MDNNNEQYDSDFRSMRPLIFQTLEDLKTITKDLDTQSRAIDKELALIKQKIAIYSSIAAAVGTVGLDFIKSVIGV